MTERARKIIDDAVRLSAEERAEIVDELLVTLGGADLHPDWIPELERRARAAHAAPDGGEPWDQVERRLRARFQRG